MMESQPHLPLNQKKVANTVTPLLGGLLLDWKATLPPLEKDLVTSQMANLLLNLICKEPPSDEQD
jgi:hypothetical protein